MNVEHFETGENLGRVEVRVDISGNESWDVSSDDADRYLSGRRERDWVSLGTFIFSSKRKYSYRPIVKARANQRQIEFVAKDATTFIRRALLEEEVNALKRGGLMPVRDSILRSSSSSAVYRRRTRNTRSTIGIRWRDWRRVSTC